MNSKDKKLQDILAQLQLDVRRSDDFLKPAAGYLAELLINGVKSADTAALVLAPIKDFLTAIKPAADGVKALDTFYTMTPEYNFINDEEVAKYLGGVNLLISKYDSRIAGLPAGERAKQDLAAEFNRDIETYFFYDAKMFRAVIWYVEALGTASLVADAPTWIAPLAKLFSDMIALVALWAPAKEAATEWVSVQGGESDWISPYDLEGGLSGIQGFITENATKAVEIRDGGETTPPVPTAPTITKSTPTSTTDGFTVEVTVDAKGETVTDSSVEVDSGTVAPTTLVDGLNTLTVTGLAPASGSSEAATISLSVTTDGGTTTDSVNGSTTVAPAPAPTFSQE